MKMLIGYHRAFSPSTVLRRGLSACLLASAGLGLLSGCTASDLDADFAGTEETASVEQAVTSTMHPDTFGGNGGWAFDDSTSNVDAQGRIKKIIVRAGERVDNITVFYANGKSYSHGGTGGSKHVIDLAADEYITGVTGRAGSKLDRITFITNKGSFGPYGGSGGNAFSVQLPDNKVLHYLHGRSGAEIDRIGFGYGDLPPALPSDIFATAPYGGTGGKSFNDFDGSPLLGKITSINVRHGERIDNIAVNYAGGTQVKHGGNGGSLSTFTLDPDEWITKITGRSSGRVNQLRFFTNKGRQSPVYGGNGGTPFTAEQGGRVLKSIYGRSGDELDSIGFFLESAPPVSMHIKSLTYDAGTITTLPIAFKTVVKNNCTDTQSENSATITVSETVETSTTVSQMHGFSLSFTVEQDFVFGSASFEAGYQYETTTEVGKTTSQTVENSYTFTATAGPWQKVTEQGTVRQVVYDIPWTAIAEVQYADDPEPTEVTVHGVLKGVSVGYQESSHTAVPADCP